MTQVPASSHGGGLAAGTYMPVADQSGAATLDTTTYDDPIRGSGKLATLILGTVQRSALGIAVAGDAFPRWVMGSNPLDGLYMGDGTYDAYNSAEPAVVSAGVNGPNHYLLLEGGVGHMSVGVGGLVSVTGLGIGTNIGINTGSIISSGALPTAVFVSGTARQLSTTRDVFLTVPVTYNPGAATTATCKVELSPDNVTYSTLLTVTQPPGTVFDGSIEPITLLVPTAWYVKLTVTNATLGTGTYY